jgi:hypothetical protein
MAQSLGYGARSAGINKIMYTYKDIQEIKSYWRGIVMWHELAILSLTSIIVVLLTIILK